MLDLIHYFIFLIYCVNTRCICISNSSVCNHMHYYFIVDYLNWILRGNTFNKQTKQSHGLTVCLMFVT